MSVQGETREKTRIDIREPKHLLFHMKLLKDKVNVAFPEGIKDDVNYDGSV